MYTNGSVATIQCAPGFEKRNLDALLRDGATWLEYDKGKYVNLAQVMSITHLVPGKTRS